MNQSVLALYFCTSGVRPDLCSHLLLWAKHFGALIWISDQQRPPQSLSASARECHLNLDWTSGLFKDKTSQSLLEERVSSLKKNSSSCKYLETHETVSKCLEFANEWSSFSCFVALFTVMPLQVKHLWLLCLLCCNIDIYVETWLSFRSVGLCVSFFLLFYFLFIYYNRCIPNT